jgi:hypothetical protein
MSAEAIAPASPWIAARMRASMPSRIASTAVANRRSQPGAAGAAAGLDGAEHHAGGVDALEI